MVCSLEVEALLIRNKLISEVLQGPIKAWENAADGGWKVVGGSAKGWTPPGPKLIGEPVPGGNITNIYFLPPQLEKDGVNQVQNVQIEVQDLILTRLKKIK